MSRKLSRTAVAATALVVASLGLAGSAQADQLCTAADDTPVYGLGGTGGGWIYTIPAGGGIHVTANLPDGWIQGHGNGHTDGRIKVTHLTNCHQI
jgi:hypothetical protein